MKKILLLLSFICLATLSYAQDDDETDELSVTSLDYTVHHPKMDMTSYKIINTFEKPYGFVVEKDGHYFIIFKEKSSWIEMPIETEGLLEKDSTRRVNLNDQGNAELVIVTSYYSDDESEETLDHEEEEWSRVYVYDLDKKTLVIDFVYDSFYKQVQTFYYDSAGTAVNVNLKKEKLFEGTTPEQRDSLNSLLDDYKESLEQYPDTKIIRSHCAYKLEKNSITLVNSGERKEFGEESFYFDPIKRVYNLVQGQWKLLK